MQQLSKTADELTGFKPAQIDWGHDEKQRLLGWEKDNSRQRTKVEAGKNKEHRQI